MTATYHGTIKNGIGEVAVWENGAYHGPLDPRFDLRNHSPSGYGWGYAGSGAAQLSLALLAHVLDDDKQALAIYQEFKFKIIAALEQNRPWTLHADQVQRIAQALDCRAGAGVGS